MSGVAHKVVALSVAVLAAAGAAMYVRWAPLEWPLGGWLTETFVTWRKHVSYPRTLWGRDLAHADLSDARLAHSAIAGCNLRWADLRRADLRDADVSFLMTSGRNPPRVLRLETDLRCADLREADLRGVRFGLCLLTGALLEGAQYDTATRWPDGFDPVAAGAVLVGDGSAPTGRPR